MTTFTYRSSLNLKKLLLTVLPLNYFVSIPIFVVGGGAFLGAAAAGIAAAKSGRLGGKGGGVVALAAVLRVCRDAAASQRGDRIRIVHCGKIKQRCYIPDTNRKQRNYSMRKGGR